MQMKRFLSAVLAIAASVTLSACETAPYDETGVAGEGYGADGQVQGFREDGSVVPGTQADLATNVGDRVFFGFDSSVLSGEAQSTLERQAAWLKANDNLEITIEGHCDERGTREYNLALGERRANAVRQYLIRLGVDADRISTISYGKERPAVLGSTESAWAQNRRAVTVVSR